MSNQDLLDELLDLEEPERLAALRTLSDCERAEFRHHWRLWGRKLQQPPEGDWTTWLILAGRGFGKTRAGAEWIRAVAEANPEARIALVGASLGEVRAVMVEGESGLLEVCPPGQVPVYEPSLRRVQWANGAQATLYSAGEPESLRGPQHSHARRAGAEGAPCQRGSRAHRCAPARRGRGRDIDPANRSGRRSGMAGRALARRSLVGPFRQARLPPIRAMAVRHAARRIAPAQPRARPGNPLSFRMDSPGSARGTEWRQHDRCRGPDGYRGNPDQPRASGNHPARMSSATGAVARIYPMLSPFRARFA